MNILNILLLISALGLSCVAAFFSIIGIATMFPGAVTAVIIMAVALEIAKIISAVWTHKNWHSVSLFSKSYLSFAVIVLMLITSMGIFGFLSKAHIEHQSVSQSIDLKVSQIDSKIKRQEEAIARNESLISKIEASEESVENRDQSIIDSNKEKIESIYERMEKDIKIDQDNLESLNDRLSELDSQIKVLREEKTGLFSSNAKKIESLEDSQSAERESIQNKLNLYTENISYLRKKAEEEVGDIRKQNETLQNKDYRTADTSLSEINNYKEQISFSYELIDKLNLEKFDLSNKNLAIETEVGPVKYVAELIVDTTGSDINLSDAVRIIILVIIFVFDPLAIMMIVCATSNFLKKNPTVKQVIVEPTIKEPEIKSKPKENHRALIKRVKATPKEKVGYTKEEPKPEPKPEPNKVSIIRSKPIEKKKKDGEDPHDWNYKKHPIT